MFQQLEAQPERPNLIVGSDLLDMALFRGLLHQRSWNVPVITYWHENQFAYPENAEDPDHTFRQDLHYPFLNYTTAMTSDANWFNSAFNRNTLLESIPAFLAQYPNDGGEYNPKELQEKSTVVPLGLDFSDLESAAPTQRQVQPPLLTWNHRWAFDKAPEFLFETLERLANDGLPFELAVLGKPPKRYPPCFERIRTTLKDRLVHWGYVSSRREYAGWLWRTALVPVTSRQDFFGISVLEAAYCGCDLLLPDDQAFQSHFTDPSIFYTRDAFEERLRDAIVRAPEGWKSQRERAVNYRWPIRISDFDARMEKWAK